ncbi:MAG: hypothetical protein WBA67_15300, partial [Jannaschia sp.]
MPPPDADRRRSGILFEIDEEPSSTRPKAERSPLNRELPSGPDPASAPPVPDDEVAPTPSGRAMQTVALLASRRDTSLAGWFWASLGAVLSFAVSVVAWNFVTGLLASNAVLGWVAAVLI